MVGRILHTIFLGTAIFIAEYWGGSNMLHKGTGDLSDFWEPSRTNLHLLVTEKKSVVGGDVNLVPETFPLKMVKLQLDDSKSLHEK